MSAPRSRRATETDAIARLFEAVHEGVFIGSCGGDAARGGEWTTLAANPHLKRMFGFEATAADDLVRPFSEEHFEDQAAQAAFFDRLTREGSVTDHLLRLRRQDGSSLWVEVTARVAPARNRNHWHLEALVRDVSERRRRDDESRDLSRQLLQAEKMAALGQTISGVAHELNNPLATILNWAERLESRPLDDTARRGVTVILAEAERAARIVRNYLTFARKRESTRGLIDLNYIVRETLALRPEEHRDGRVERTVTLGASIPKLFADGHQMQQVLLNLVTNAEQAMLAANGHGILTVRTQHDTARGYAVLEVRDDGPGIPAEARSKIFDPFFTTKGVGSGTGLGLTVAYAIVQEHGGRIRVECPPEGGTVFFVDVPVFSVEHPQTTASVEAGAGADAATRPAENVQGAVVLLVEDEPWLATTVAEALTDAGARVDHAADGGEALAHVRQRAYDVVVCDLKMPRVDGMVLYRAIATEVPGLARRIIFVTGDVAGTDAERFLAETGNRWLAKPFRLADLLRAVRDARG